MLDVSTGRSIVFMCVMWYHTNFVPKYNNRSYTAIIIIQKYSRFWTYHVSVCTRIGVSQKWQKTNCENNPRAPFRFRTHRADNYVCLTHQHKRPTCSSSSDLHKKRLSSATFSGQRVRVRIRDNPAAAQRRWVGLRQRHEDLRN